MSGLNFFESKIDINIMIHRGSHIIVSCKGRTLFEGIREYCWHRIVQMINDISLYGEKEIVFHIQNMTTGDPQHERDKLFFKSHLSRLNTSSKCRIEVRAGLYDVFA